MSQAAKPNRPNLINRLFAPVDGASLVVFRIAFGLIMLWEVFRYFNYGWIDYYWVEPTFHFTYFGFDWVKPWSQTGMIAHFVVLGCLAVCIALGFLYRLATMLFFLGFTYIFLLDQATYLNHFYLISLVAFALIFVPANRALSLDVLLKITKPSRVVPFWSVAFIAFLVAIPYFFGGIAKLNTDWLQGEPMRDWLGDRQDFPVIGRFFAEEWMIYAFSWGGAIFDLVIVPLLLWKPTRKLAFVTVVGFHLMNSEMFHIGIFPWFMIAATPIFFSPSWPRLFLRFFKKTRRADRPSPEIFKPNRFVVAGLAAFVFVQITVPLRHWLYPGNVNWTEEGHRFSWHMKLRDKDSSAHFYVFDPKNKQQWIVDPKNLLSARQARKMASRPDMILQFSHHLAEKFESAGVKNVEVRAHVTASLNSRPPEMLISSATDLAKEERNLKTADWILPLTTPLRITAK